VNEEVCSSFRSAELSPSRWDGRLMVWRIMEWVGRGGQLVRREAGW